MKSYVRSITIQKKPKTKRLPSRVTLLLLEWFNTVAFFSLLKPFKGVDLKEYTRRGRGGCQKFRHDTVFSGNADFKKRQFEQGVEGLEHWDSGGNTPSWQMLFQGVILITVVRSNDQRSKIRFFSTSSNFCGRYSEGVDGRAAPNGAAEYVVVVVVTSLKAYLATRSKRGATKLPRIEMISPLNDGSWASNTPVPLLDDRWGDGWFQAHASLAVRSFLSWWTHRWLEPCFSAL